MHVQTNGAKENKSLKSLRLLFGPPYRAIHDVSHVSLCSRRTHHRIIVGCIPPLSLLILVRIRSSFHSTFVTLSASVGFAMSLFLARGHVRAETAKNFVDVTIPPTNPHTHITPLLVSVDLSLFLVISASGNHFRICLPCQFTMYVCTRR